MSSLQGRTAVVTGGTSGIGAATALLLQRGGAEVTVIGRSRAKADDVLARAGAGPGRLRAIVADLSSMATVQDTVGELAGDLERIDLLVHAVGILIARTEHTAEGLEKDFAVGYLSRFVFLETAARHGLLHPGTRMVNVAASAPRVPRFARVEFDDLAAVQRRTGMAGHGQAQLANDLLTAQAPARYGITAVGYGPGSVRTGIRRELPGVVQAVMKPFFHFTTREPDEVAAQLVEILAEDPADPGVARFHGRSGPFPAAPYVTDPARQRDLLRASTALVEKALGNRSVREGGA